MSNLEMHCTNPDCARRIRLPEKAIGRRIRCPACHQEMHVPGTIEELHKLAGVKKCRVAITHGPAFVGQEHTLDPDRAYTIGRSDECNIQLPGPTVSKRHFTLHWVNHEWVLEDLNTTTGTQVNGLGVTKQALHGGERIELGSYGLEFHTPQEHLTASSSGAHVVVPAGDARPLPVSNDLDEAERVQRQADRDLVQARGYGDFKSEHLADVGRDSSQRYSLSLATRLVALAFLLVAATVLSIFGKTWFFPDSSSNAASAHSMPDQVAPEPLPGAFVTALHAQDFELAARLIEECSADEFNSPALVERMRNQLEGDIHRRRGELLYNAQRADHDDDWDEVRRLIATAEKLGSKPLRREWQTLRKHLRQKVLIGEAQIALDEEHWNETLRILKEAEGLDRSNSRVIEMRYAAKQAMGGGLLLKLDPIPKQARVMLDGREVEATGCEQWKLPVGARTLEIAAPGFFEHQQRIQLEAGQLTVVEVALAALAPPELWALLALERAGEFVPLWIAARHYADQAALDPPLTDWFVNQYESHAARELKRVNLRVARITLADGGEITARIRGETASSLTVQLLPGGEAKVIRAETVASVEDFEREQATRAVLEWIVAEREAGATLLKTLFELARLRFDLGADAQTARQVCGSHLADCLTHLHDACAYCAGRADMACPVCAGRGFNMQMVTCPNCNGTRQVNCFKCRGSGKVTCTRCRGKGKISKTEGSGTSRRRVKETCPTCDGSGKISCPKCNARGKVTCPKCKGAGEIEDRVTCPECAKGRVPCPVCGGRGTKEAMDPAKQREAELEAAKRAHEPGAGPPPPADEPHYIRP